MRITRTARHSALATLLFSAVAAVPGCAAGPEEEDLPAQEEEAELTGESQQALFEGRDVRSGVASGRCLDVKKAVVANGTNVQLYACNGTNAQKWYLTSAGEFRSALNTTYCLDVSGAGTAPGTNVQLWACNGTNAQKWTVTAKGEVRSMVAPNRCLDVSGAGTSNGTNVQIYTCNDTVAQQWFDVPSLPVSDTEDHPVTIDGVWLSDGGLFDFDNSLVRVAPGQELLATVFYTIYQSAWCPSCLSEIQIGFPDRPQGCAYVGYPSAAGTSGSAVLSITAPSTPGVYYLRFRYGIDWKGCDPVNWSYGVPGEDNDIAVITVE